MDTNLHHEKEDTSVRFSHFAACLAGYAILMVLAMTIEFPKGDIPWYYMLLLVPLPLVGLMMQFIPYLYIKNLLIRRGIMNADKKAVGIWLTALVIYSIIITLFAQR
jgi:hypothetical protein